MKLSFETLAVLFKLYHAFAFFKKGNPDTLIHTDSPYLSCTGFFCLASMICCLNVRRGNIILPYTVCKLKCTLQVVLPSQSCFQQCPISRESVKKRGQGGVVVSILDQQSRDPGSSPVLRALVYFHCDTE